MRQADRVPARIVEAWAFRSICTAKPEKPAGIEVQADSCRLADGERRLCIDRGPDTDLRQEYRRPQRCQASTDRPAARLHKDWPSIASTSAR